MKDGFCTSMMMELDANKAERGLFGHDCKTNETRKKKKRKKKQKEKEAKE